MVGSVQNPTAVAVPVYVPTGEDRFGKYKSLGLTHIDFKVTVKENKDFSVMEISLDRKGGPARHLHYYQDEYFYILEGNFIIEVGDQRFNVKPGDSLFAPKMIPHAWAFAEGTHGRFLAVLSPAGNLEQFFIEADKNKALPGPDQNLWKTLRVGMGWTAFKA